MGVAKIHVRRVERVRLDRERLEATQYGESREAAAANLPREQPERDAARAALRKGALTFAGALANKAYDNVFIITTVRLTEGSCLGDRLIDWVCGGRWVVST